MSVALAFAAPLEAAADRLPLWELGAGVAVVNFPDYRGSNERRTLVLPVPYLVYRGDFFKVEEQRLRGLFFKLDPVEIDVSLNGSIPVKSEDNQARAGMPDLDPTLEIGPSLNWTLARSTDRALQLDFRLPLRAVIAADFSHVQYVGLVAQPHLNLDIKNVLGGAGWNMGVLVGPYFGDQRHYQYFYGVDPAFATADRPAYSASGGYGGSQAVVALSKRFPQFWVGGFVKWDTLSGAAFADSPLVKSRQSASAGFAISWIFDVSKTLVEAER